MKKFSLLLLMAIIVMTASAQTTFNDGTFKYELTTLNTTGETVAKITGQSPRLPVGMLYHQVLTLL